MKHKILSRPAASVAKLKMDDGESLTCEVGAMIAMTTDFEVETTTKKKGAKGGIGKALKRMFAGESFFLNHFTATNDSQSLIIGPRMLGDILHFPLSGGSLIVQGSSWLASDTEIDIDTTWQGFGKAMFSGESMFFIHATTQAGAGRVYYNSYGAVKAMQIQQGQSITVDTGHVVAFTNGVQYNVGKVGGLKSLAFGGEGLVMHFSGEGTVWIQTRNLGSLASNLIPFWPKG